MVVCMNGTTVPEGSGGATCGEWRPGAVARGGRCRERREEREEEGNKPAVVGAGLKKRHRGLQQGGVEKPPA